MDYYTQKAKRMYELYLKGEPCRKVYAAVRKEDKYAVIKNAEGKKWKYQLAGGGVEDGETNKDAIVREVLEELNINSKIVERLGVISYETKWKYEDKEFAITNEAEVYLVDFVSFSNNEKFGLDGEFSENEIKGRIFVSEEEMCSNVYEFTSGGIKFKS